MVSKLTQSQIEAKLNSGQVIIKDGNIILNPEWIWNQEKERLRIKYQAIREEWKQKQQAKVEEEQWQKQWTRIESCLIELEKGGKEAM